MKRVAIIGSGFGGLALAVRLQSRGFEVSIYEKNEQTGGHAYPFRKQGYTFDMGPSLITATDILGRLFKAGGRDLYTDLDLVHLDPFYRIYFHDGSHMDYSGDTERMRDQIRSFNARDAKHFDRFLKASEKIYKVVIEEGEGSKPFMTLFSMLKFAPRAIAMKSMLSTYQFASLYFKDPRNRFVFSFHPLFIGGNPFRAPAIYEMIPYLEKTDGVLYSKGGMYSLVKALENMFIQNGGTVHTNTQVNEIIVKNGRACGVRSGRTEFDADLVVSNADFIHTYRDLLKPEHRKKWTDRRLSKVGYSMSAFMLYLGVKKQYPQLLHHTLILSHRYRALIRDIFDRHVLPDDFSMYLHVPTRTEPAMAPDGCESMYVLVPVTNLQGAVNWEQEKHRFADRILGFLQHDFGLEGLQEALEVKEIFTPDDFKKKQNAVYGAAWGVEPKLMQSAYFRPHNRSEDVKDLYLVGASTHPGAGLPGCLLTAETTESVITSEHE